VQGLQSEVNIATISGRVSIQRTGRVTASSTVTTVNGDVVLQLPTTAGAEVHASTVSGDLRSDFPVYFMGRSASAAQAPVRFLRIRRAFRVVQVRWASVAGLGKAALRSES